MKWGVLCKKVENGGAFFEKMDFSSTQRALCAVSVFFILHFAYLGVRTQPVHPLHTACTASNDGTCYGLSVCLSVLFACRS